MSSKLDYCVFILRGQPFTEAHKGILLRAFDNADKVIIILGSHNSTLTPHNPLTTEERMIIIKHSMADYCNVAKDLFITAVPDSTYNMDAWTALVSSKVQNVVELSHLSNTEFSDNPTISLIGHHKDSSSFYLDHFPQWGLIEVENLENGLNATTIRNLLYRIENSLLDLKDETEFVDAVYKLMPEPAARYFYQIIQDNMERFLSLRDEYNFCIEYYKPYLNLPFDVSFNTTDNLVICKGHVLVIKRGRHPGKGLFAMPGGFLDRNETLQQGAARELKEETSIKINKAVLKKSLVGNKHGYCFDHPHRDPRGRFITHVFHYNLDDQASLPSIKAADDAHEAIWMPLGELSKHQSNFFIDHWSIIKKITNV